MDSTEIEDLRQRIHRLEWLITVMRDEESIEALKSALIDAQHRLEELLKRAARARPSAQIIPKAVMPTVAARIMLLNKNRRTAATATRSV